MPRVGIVISTFFPYIYTYILFAFGLVSFIKSVFGTLRKFKWVILVIKKKLINKLYDDHDLVV